MGGGRSHPFVSTCLLYPGGDKGDRSGPPAVAEDVDFRGVLSLHRECDGYYSVVAIRANTT